MEEQLAQMRCIPARPGPPLRDAELETFLNALGGAWSLTNDGRIERTFRFRDFRDALGFTNKVGALAESEFHHPELELEWGRVTVKLHTFTAHGVTENDFILAAKIDLLFA